VGVVLVVEDNALVTGAMRVLLESGGHNVMTAVSVAEAVTRCSEMRPDLMLLDLTLPDGNGLEVLTRVSAPDSLPLITVALTGHDDPDVRKRCLDAGCRAVLLKPVAARELVSAVDSWIAEARAGAARES